MKEKKIEIYDCKPGAIIARDIIDVRSGVVLCHKGHVLTDDSIKWLNKFLCSEIYIQESSWEKAWNISKEETASYEESKEALYSTFLSVQTGKSIDNKVIDTIKDSFFTDLNNNNVIMGCVNIVKSLDEYTYAHSLNVAMLAVLIGKWMGLPEQQVEELFSAGVLHDVGKYRVDQRLINKNGSLAKWEYALVKKHAIEGYEIIKDNESLSDAIKEGVLCHHERIDGSGYPRALVGEEIHLYGRILAIADTYDAMISEKSYRKRQTPFEVMEIMLSESIDKLDTKILLTFLKNMADYYIGVYVTLNTGQVGEVVFIHPHCIYRPIVKVDETYYDLDTHPELHILEMV